MIATEGGHGVDAPPGWSGPVGALLLDLDGTLIDTDAAATRAVAVSFGSLVGDLDDDAARTLAVTWLADRDGWFHRYEAGEIDFAEQRRRRYLEVAAELGLGADQYAAWEPAYVSALIGGTAGYPDTLAFLDAVTDLPVAIVTNVDTAVQLEKLAVAGLAERFPVVVGVDVAAAPKPDPAPFLAACELLGVTRPRPFTSATAGRRTCWVRSVRGCAPSGSTGATRVPGGSSRPVCGGWAGCPRCRRFCGRGACGRRDRRRVRPVWSGPLRTAILAERSSGKSVRFGGVWCNWQHD